MPSLNKRFRQPGTFTHIYNTDQAEIGNIVAKKSCVTPEIILRNGRICVGDPKTGNWLSLPKVVGNRGDVLINDGSGQLLWGKNERVIDLLKPETFMAEPKPLLALEPTVVDTQAIVEEIAKQMIREEVRMEEKMQIMVYETVDHVIKNLKESDAWEDLKDQNNMILTQRAVSPLELSPASIPLPLTPVHNSLVTPNVSTSPGRYVLNGLVTLPSSATTGTRIYFPFQTGHAGNGSKNKQPCGIAPFPIKPVCAFLVRTSGKGNSLSYSLIIEKKIGKGQHVVAGSATATGNLNDPTRFEFRDVNMIEAGTLFNVILTSHTGEPGTPTIYYTLVFDRC